ATFAQDGRVEHAVIGDVNVVVSITSTGVLRRWRMGRAKPGGGDNLGDFRGTSRAPCPLGEGAAGGGQKGQGRLYAGGPGERLRPLGGHTKEVAALAFSPDGKRIVTGGADTTVRVWDVEKGKQLTELPGHTARVTAIACGPGGDRIVTGSADK